jgi:uncharacterized membrane protein YbhN (UPF0104 family)
MKLKEALFWLGITIFGTALYFVFQEKQVSAFWALFLTAIGFFLAALSVAYHHLRKRQRPSPTEPPSDTPKTLSQMPFSEWRIRAAFYILLSVAALALVAALLAFLYGGATHPSNPLIP